MKHFYNIKHDKWNKFLVVLDATINKLFGRVQMILIIVVLQLDFQLNKWPSFVVCWVTGLLLSLIYYIYKQKSKKKDNRC